MKRFALLLIVAFCLLALAATAFAEGRNHKFKEFYFGDSYHKSPAGVGISYVKAKWTANGMSEMNFEISAFKGKVAWDDMYLVDEVDGKQVITYKLSDKRKMGKVMCYIECVNKKFVEKLFFEPNAGPFTMEKGQVWYVFSHGGWKYHVIWEMAGNTMAWYKAADKPVPPMMPAPEMNE